MELPRRNRGDELLKPGELAALRQRVQHLVGLVPDDAVLSVVPDLEPTKKKHKKGKKKKAKGKNRRAD